MQELEKLKLALSLKPAPAPRRAPPRAADTVAIATSNLPGLDWSAVITPKGRASNFMPLPARQLPAGTAPPAPLGNEYGYTSAPAPYGTSAALSSQTSLEAGPSAPSAPLDPFVASPAVGAPGCATAGRWPAPTSAPVGGDATASYGTASYGDGAGEENPYLAYLASRPVRFALL